MILARARPRAGGRAPRFDTAERWRLAGLAGAVALLHAIGFGIVFLYAGSHPILVGLATLAYGFGLRHAFDADHIAAIDNTTRKLLQQGRRPLGLGFSFSLGHSTVVFAMAVGFAVAAHATDSAIGTLQGFGGYVSTAASATFLWTIGILNLLVLIDIAKIARGLRSGRYDERQLEQRLLDRGFMSRFFLGRLFRFVDKSWHMYPIGALFGLGFETASEVGLLALAATAAGGGTPVVAILALPILFAAGMSMMDRADGVFMSRAYSWAFSTPARKVFYNLTVTSLSVMVALLVGSVELIQVAISKLGLHGGVWGWLGALDFETLGYGIVGLFAVTWIAASVIWRFRRIEQRWTSQMAAAGASQAAIVAPGLLMCEFRPNAARDQGEIHVLPLDRPSPPPQPSPGLWMLEFRPAVAPDRNEIHVLPVDPRAAGGAALA